MLHSHRLRCPVCESDRLHWELHRMDRRDSRVATRVLVWSCRACGSGWNTSVSLQEEGGGGVWGELEWREPPARPPLETPTPPPAP